MTGRAWSLLRMVHIPLIAFFQTLLLRQSNMVKISWGGLYVPEHPMPNDKFSTPPVLYLSKHLTKDGRRTRASFRFIGSHTMSHHGLICPNARIYELRGENRVPMVAPTKPFPMRHRAINSSGGKTPHHPLRTQTLQSVQ